ncbi:MAG: DUF3179 domain-containing protein [Amylibacter sp.]|nr:DUF3179 domain-containing protein [Amylibacter sp.]
MLRFISILLASLFFTSTAFAQVSGWKYEWPNTDFSKKSVEFSEILSGGPGKDGIPAILEPKFHKVSDEQKLGSREPVMTVELAGQVPRAYPIRYLMWHEIVNDVIGDVPIAVTFCPLCNSGVTFDRRVMGRTLTMGVTGKLRYSDMVMYDHETQSWWQQFMGLGIVGEMTGVRLKTLPSWTESWADFKARNPQAIVMQEPEGSRRRYGANPYAGYDTGRPFLYKGEDPPYGIHPLARVVVVGSRAWPLERFKNTAVINEAGVRISWKSGTASALDTRSIAKGRDVGAIRVRDAITGKDIAHDVSFAFAFYAFHPQGTWMLGD